MRGRERARREKKEEGMKNKNESKMIVWESDGFWSHGWQRREKQIKRQLGFIIRYGEIREYR